MDVTVRFRLFILIQVVCILQVKLGVLQGFKAADDKSSERDLAELPADGDSLNLYILDTFLGLIELMRQVLDVGNLLVITGERSLHEVCHRTFLVN